MAGKSDRSNRLRSADIVKLMSPRPMWRLIRSMVRAPFDPNFAGLPLAVCWFTNFSCNAFCHFCCKAREIRDGHDRFPPLSLTKARTLLEKIRASVDMLYLSGGEPLVHPHVSDILAYARELKFTSIGISTNLIALDRHLDVLEYVDAISVSIHSPDPAVNALNLGLEAAKGEKVLQNLELLKNHPRRDRFKILVNCVINKKNLHTVLDMVEFTRTHGLLLEMVPANSHGQTPNDLAGNAQYEKLIDTLIQMRKSGQVPHLAGSTAYYRHIRSFEPFRCFPYGVPNIMPDGRLCTPCDVSEQYALNVLDYPNLKSAVLASYPHLGAYPCKKGKCFKAGILERSHLFGLLVGNYPHST